MHNLFLVYFFNRYMFREYLGPSSGGKSYVNSSWYLLFFLDYYLLSWLDCSNPTRTKDSHLKRIISTNCCAHTIYLLMMGLDTPETCSGWRNILRISCASSWFFFTRLYRHVRSTKPKKKAVCLPKCGVGICGVSKVTPFSIFNGSVNLIY